MRNKLVIIESPCRGLNKTQRKLYRNYAILCVADSFTRGECPFASHLFYDQEGILNDNDPIERRIGIEAGLAWGKLADLTAVYADLGISGGMNKGIEEARNCNRRIVKRTLWPYGEIVEVKIEGVTL